MNYQRIHDTIIDRARGRTPEDGVYYEWHHVHPKCEGGHEDGETVPLTLREHILVHRLWHKRTGHKGHLGAIGLMTGDQELRREFVSHAARLSHIKFKERDSEGYTERQRLAGRVGGQSAYEKKTGFHARTTEQRRETGYLVGTRHADNRVGMFSDEYRKEHAEGMKKVVRDEESGIIYNSCMEAAQALGVNPGTITYRIKTGKITILETGPIRRKMQ